MTVDALLEATARILVSQGYEAASTNKIAAVAGVSIGSLYQYYPSKEALVAAVAERHAQALLQVGRDTLLKAAAQPIEIAARELVAAGIEAHRVDPKLHRVLAEEAPRAGSAGNIDSVQHNSCAFLRAYLEAHREEIDVPDLDLAAFILVTVLEAVTHAAVLHRPDLLTDDKAEALMGETTRLVLRYLAPSSPNRHLTPAKRASRAARPTPPASSRSGSARR